MRRLVLTLGALFLIAVPSVAAAGTPRQHLEVSASTTAGGQLVMNLMINGRKLDNATLSATYRICLPTTPNCAAVTPLAMTRLGRSAHVQAKYRVPATLRVGDRITLRVVGTYNGVSQTFERTITVVANP